MVYDIAVKADREKKQLLMTVYGRAGSGKSVVLAALKGHFVNQTVTGAMTASAAFLVGGTTLHQLVGLPSDESRRFNLSNQ